MDDQNSELKKALRSVSNILSKRSHSLKELKQKLSLKYSDPIVTKVLEVAQENKWLESEDVLFKQTVAALHQKNKSWAYIKNYLEKKGLPLPEYDREKELEKSLALLSKKSLSAGSKSFEDREKGRRFLLYRGFEADIILEILGE